MSHAGKDHWDAVFRELKARGEDLDWEDRWLDAHLPHLRAAKARTVLDLGCGTGNEVIRLARAGYRATGLDFSGEALRQAQEKADREHLDATLVEGDMARPLPFADASFDAVTSNVALHMFDDRTTRSLFGEVHRVVRPGGVFVFHVNSVADADLRARRRPPVRQLEPDYVLEQDGQTMRFFSRAYLLELLRPWEGVRLKPVEILDRETGEPFKRVWRGAAKRRGR